MVFWSVSFMVNECYGFIQTGQADSGISGKKRALNNQGQDTGDANITVLNVGTFSTPVSTLLGCDINKKWRCFWPKPHINVSDTINILIILCLYSIYMYSHCLRKLRARDFSFFLWYHVIGRLSTLATYWPSHLVVRDTPTHNSATRAVSIAKILVALPLCQWTWDIKLINTMCTVSRAPISFKTVRAVLFRYYCCYDFNYGYNDWMESWRFH